MTLTKEYRISIWWFICKVVGLYDNKLMDMPEAFIYHPSNKCLIWVANGNEEQLMAGF